MAYPYTAQPKKARVAEALQSALQGIRRSSGYYHDVRAVHIYEGEDIILGTTMPSIVIVPSSQARRTQVLSCNVGVYLWDVTLVLNARIVHGSDDWKSAMQFFVADVTKAIDADIQLGGEAVYAEIKADDLFDVGSSGDIAQAEVSVTIQYRQSIADPSK